MIAFLRLDHEQRFFSQPILNSPYEYPARHWELDAEGQPTQKIIESRREAKFITPIPRAQKQKKQGPKQRKIEFYEEAVEISTDKQKYETESNIN